MTNWNLSISTIVIISVIVSAFLIFRYSLENTASLRPFDKRMHQSGMPEYSRMAFAALKNKIKELTKKYDLALIGTGGSMRGSIDTISLTFVTKKSYSPQERVAVFVHVVDGLIDALNSDQAIRPYFKNYPMNVKNFEILIGFYTQYPAKDSEDFLIIRGLVSVTTEINKIESILIDHEKYEDFKARNL